MANLSNINNKFIVTDGGNVLIGQTSAVGTPILQVTGTNHLVTFKNTSTTANTYAQLLIQAGDATNYIWTAAQNSTNWAGSRSLNIYTAQTGANIGFFTEGDASNTKLMILGDGNVGIGTNSPDAILNISKTSFSTTFTSADSYIRIGKGENATNGYQFIGFGYNNGSADLVPAYIGYQQTGTPGNYTKGDLVFGTRNVTTNTAPTERMRISSAGGIQFNSYGAGVLVTDASGNITAVVDPPVDGITFNNGATITNQINTDVDTGTETIASVAIATHDSAFFDFVIKKTTNVRSGTVYACHDGTSVVFTETSTQDLGNTSDVTLSVDISGTEMRLRATTTSDNWSIKSLIRAI
jgi:hypothetical protein